MRCFTVIRPILSHFGISRPGISRLALLIVAGMFLSACAETQFLIHTAKRVNQQQGEKSEGYYKVGNPYQIGDIVLASVDGDFTVKILSKHGAQPRLLPANEKYQPIDVKKDSAFEIWGTVTGAVRKFK